MMDRAVDVALKGKGVPAFFNDETVVASLVAHGIPLGDARDYGIVGCVEQAIPARAFCPPTPPFSTCPSAWSWP